MVRGRGASPKQSDLYLQGGHCRAGAAQNPVGDDHANEDSRQIKGVESALNKVGRNLPLQRVICKIPGQHSGDFFSKTLGHFKGGLHTQPAHTDQPIPGTGLRRQGAGQKNKAEYVGHIWQETSQRLNRSAELSQKTDVKGKEANEGNGVMGALCQINRYARKFQEIHRVWS